LSRIRYHDLLPRALDRFVDYIMAEEGYDWKMGVKRTERVIFSTAIAHLLGRDGL
jgi:hypothetical protein